MLRMKYISKEVYVADEPIVHVGREEVEFLKQRVHDTERRRIRLCAHRGIDDKLQEMFIVLSGETYLRPSKHLNKDESLHIIEGLADYVFFDEAGNITDVLSLGDYASGCRSYCRIPESANHALLVRSDVLVIHETTEGPFRRSDTVFASWAPDEGDKTAINKFICQLSVLEKEKLDMMRMKANSKEVCVADEPIVSVGRPELEFLKGRVRDSERKRIRLCAHKDIQDKLHEMFVVYLGETYVRPNKHLQKDESLHILEGAADFIFFDEVGNITDVIPLGDYASGRRFYCRVPESAYHTLIMRSDVLVIHEATPGPFRKSDTIFAPWAPEEGDTIAVNKFIEKLSGVAENFIPTGKELI